MKRVLTVLSLLFVPLLVLAENKIKMVTYFPVPYVAYSKINAQKQLDVGLTSACEMNLGCAESGALGTKPLQVTTANLNRGRLDLNNASAVKSTNVTLGSGSGETNIDFDKNLRIGTLSNGYSLEANDMTVDELKLFASHMRAGGEKFPSCAATGASGAPQISWQKLKLKSAEEVYLMCGTPTEEKDPCAGQVKSKWDGTRCVCPGSSMYYVSSTNACCSNSTPKTNSQCWKPVYGKKFAWVQQTPEKESCTVDKNNGAMGEANCRRSCANYNTLGYGYKKCDSRIKVGQGCVEDTPAGGYSGSTGEGCVLSCSTSESNYYQGYCPSGHTCYQRTTTWTMVRCMTSDQNRTEPTYQPRWNSYTDKNY